MPNESRSDAQKFSCAKIDSCQGTRHTLAPMMKSSLALLILPFLLVAFSAVAAEEDNTALPFSVSIGGQAAAIKAAHATHATIEKPVAADAPLEVGAKGDMIIVNVAAADEKGAPKEGPTPAVILIQGGNKTTLDKTMDGKKLAPGNYLLAAVAEGKTASVFFKIQ